MNKTINVNISGFSFTLDEDAYAHLKDYLDRLRIHFSREEGSEEIMADIESRLAELLIGLLGKRQVVSSGDVRAVITQLGMPEDFELPHDESQRPESAVEEETGSRRFYRDPDHAVLGGVCSGISAYFNVDPIWLRLAFVVGLFVFGSGLLLYLILWIIMPEARTPAERLRMKGRGATISNIERDFREGVYRAGDQIRRVTRGSGFERLVHRHGGTFIRVIGIFFAIVAVFMLAGLVATITGGGVLALEWLPEFSTHILSPGWPRALAPVALLLIAGVPVLVILVKGVTWAMKIRFRSKLFNVAMLLAWFCGIGFAVAIGVDLGSDFSSAGTFRFEEKLEPSGKTILVKPLSFAAPSGSHRDGNDLHHSRLAGDSLQLTRVTLNIAESVDTTASLVASYRARGKTRAEAMKRASLIEHRVVMRDSTLLIDPWFGTGQEPFRAQRVELTLQIPKGFSVRVSRELDYTLVEDYTYDRQLGDVTIRF